MNDLEIIKEILTKNYKLKNELRKIVMEGNQFEERVFNIIKKHTLITRTDLYRKAQFLRSEISASKVLNDIIENLLANGLIGEKSIYITNENKLRVSTAYYRL